MLAIFDALGPRYAVSFLASILEGDEGASMSLEIRTLMDFFDRLSSNNHIKKKGGFSFRPCREINDLFVNMTNFEIHH